MAAPVETDRFASDVPAALTTHTCATSAVELRERVANAFTGRNAVALSGLLLWDGYRGREATSELQSLARLVVEPLVAIDIEEAVVEPAYDREDIASSREPWRGRALSIRTARDLDHVPHEARTSFAIANQGGCWWLRPGH